MAWSALCREAGVYASVGSDIRRGTISKPDTLRKFAAVMERIEYEDLARAAGYLDEEDLGADRSGSSGGGGSDQRIVASLKEERTAYGVQENPLDVPVKFTTFLSGSFGRSTKVAKPVDVEISFHVPSELLAQFDIPSELKLDSHLNIVLLELLCRELLYHRLRDTAVNDIEPVDEQE